MKREVTCLRLGKESRGQSTCAGPSPVRALHLLLPPQSPLNGSVVNPSGMFRHSFRTGVALFSPAVQFMPQNEV